MHEIAPPASIFVHVEQQSIDHMLDFNLTRTNRAQPFIQDMQFIKSLTSHISGDESTGKQTSNGHSSEIVSPIFDRTPAKSRKYNADSWSFSGLDKENQVDDDGDIVVTAEKRDGIFQDLKRPQLADQSHEKEPSNKKVKIEDDADLSMRDLQHHTAEMSTGSRTTAVKAPLTNETSNYFATKHSENTRTSDTKSQDSHTTSRKLPFLVDNDSDNESPFAQLPEVGLCEVYVKPQRRLNAAEEEASRLESRRLRHQAQERKKGMSGIQDQEAQRPRLTHDNFIKASPQASGGFQACASQQRDTRNYNIHPTPNPTTRSTLDCDTPISSKELDMTKTYTPHSVRDPAEMKRDLAKRLGNHAPKNADHQPHVDGPSVENAWNEAEVTKRAAAAKARKEADAKRDAEWQKKRAQERLQERELYEKKRTAKAESRQSVPRAVTINHNDINARNNALGRLRQASVVRKTNPTAKAEAESPENSTDGPADALTAVPAEVSSHVAPKLAAPVSDEIEKGRQDRIKEMNERNARLRVAEAEQARGEEEVAAREVLEAPRSLNSIEARNLLARSEDYNGERARGDQRNRSDRRKGHERRLLPIEPSDVKLLVWRDRNELQWKEIATLFEQTYGQRRAPRTIQGRCHQVKSAIEEADADKAILRSAAAGDADALALLNAKLAENPENKRVDQPSTNYSGVFRAPQNADHHRGAKFTTIIPPITPTAEPQDRQSSLAEAIDAAGTGQVAGKTWGPEAFKHYLECLADAHGLDDYPEQPKIPTQEDQCHFTYQVQRRQIDNEQMQDGRTIDDILWIGIGDDYDNLAEANTAAIATIWRKLPNHKHVALQDVDLSCKTSDGPAFLEIKGENGIAQVRVVSFIRSYEDGELPSRPDSLLSRTLYFIMERTVTISGDEFFEGVHREVKETPVSKKCYTALSQANEDAVKMYVALGFELLSRNLNARDKEVRMLERELLDEIDEEEGEMFCSDSLWNDDKTVEKKVWVDDGRLTGPRNIK